MHLELGNRQMSTMSVKDLIEALKQYPPDAVIDIEMYDQHGDPLGTSAYLRLDFAVDELEDPLVIITSAIDEDRSAAKAQGGPTP